MNWNFDVGGVVGAVASGISAIGSRRRQEKLMQKQYEYQQMAADAQQQREIQLMQMQNREQREMWKMNNEYNSPAAQRQRLEDANLLGASLFGGAAPGAPATMPTAASGSASTPSMPFSSSIATTPGLDSALKMSSLLQGIANIDLTRAKTENTSEDTALKKTQSVLNQVTARYTSIKSLGQEWLNKSAELNATITEATKDFTVESAALAVKTARQQLKSLAEDYKAKVNKNSLFGLEKKQVEQGLMLQIAQLCALEAKTEYTRTQNTVALKRLPLELAMLNLQIEDGTILKTLHKWDVRMRQQDYKASRYDIQSKSYEAFEKRQNARYAGVNALYGTDIVSSVISTFHRMFNTLNGVQSATHYREYDSPFGL